VLDASGSFHFFCHRLYADAQISEDFEITPELWTITGSIWPSTIFSPMCRWSREQDFIRNRLKTEIFNLTLGVAKAMKLRLSRSQIQRLWK